MNKKSLVMTIISMMIIAALVLPTAGSSPVAAKDVTELKLFQASKFDAHYVVPRDATVETLLEDEGVILPGANAAQIEAAVQKFRTEWAKRNPDTPNPQKLEELLKGEQGCRAGRVSQRDHF
jgi:hypothetical protein